MANILVCDDDKEIVDAIEIYLSNEGYHIYKAYDGEQAISMLAEGGCPSADHGYHDAALRWDQSYLKDQGIQQHPDHHAVCQVRGYGQDPGAEYRSR